MAKPENIMEVLELFQKAYGKEGWKILLGSVYPHVPVKVLDSLIEQAEWHAHFNEMNRHSR
jgi:hypothetical protein